MEEFVGVLDYLILLLAEIILEDKMMLTQLKAFIKSCFLLAIMILSEMILVRRIHAK